MQYLNAVFWDYPQLNNPESVRAFLSEKRDAEVYRWVMTRFLEHGRVVDTLGFFSIEEIARTLPQLRLTPYSLRKWKRLVEIYGGASGE